PLPGLEPHSLHGAELHTQHVRRLLVGESEEVLHLDQRAPFRLGGCEPFEEPVHGNGHVHSGAAGGEKVLNSIEGHELRVRASAGMVDQVSAHGSTCYSEKMPPILPILVFGGYQTEVDLVYQFGGLQGVALALALHQVTRQPP